MRVGLEQCNMFSVRFNMIWERPSIIQEHWITRLLASMRALAQ